MAANPAVALGIVSGLAAGAFIYVRVNERKMFTDPINGLRERYLDSHVHFITLKI